MRAIVQDRYGQADVLRLREDAAMPQIGDERSARTCRASLASTQPTGT